MDKRVLYFIAMCVRQTEGQVAHRRATAQAAR